MEHILFSHFWFGRYHVLSVLLMYSTKAKFMIAQMIYGQFNFTGYQCGTCV